MKKVLLAVIGAICDQKTFRYALQLSRQIEAELDVLQVVDTGDAGSEPEEKFGVRYHRTTYTKNPEAEIARYVRRHRDVVFTIYDTSADCPQQPKIIPKEIRNLPIPLVLVRP